MERPPPPKRPADAPSAPAAKRVNRGSISIMAPTVLRDVNVFTKKNQVGQGTYGIVFVGQDKATNEIVALKRINTEQEENGFPITAIREVKILKALHHVNIVTLKEIVTSKGALFDFFVCRFRCVGK
jgi:serine/threonine protein kinase